MAVKCHKFSSGANLDVVQRGGGEDREKGESNHLHFTINVTIALAR